MAYSLPTSSDRESPIQGTASEDNAFGNLEAAVSNPAQSHLAYFIAFKASAREANASSRDAYDQVRSATPN